MKIETNNKNSGRPSAVLSVKKTTEGVGGSEVQMCRCADVQMRGRWAEDHPLTYSILSLALINLLVLIHHSIKTLFIFNEYKLAKMPFSKG